MNLQELLHRIRRKLTKLCLQPIRVFCFHQASDTYDPDVYCKPDWVPLSFLQELVKQLQFEGCEFISLTDAYDKIANDRFRNRKYAVLTADDGLLCHADLLPWLEEQHIPITLFVNVQYLDGKSCGGPVKKYFKIETEEEEHIHASRLYCTEEQIFGLSSPILSIGMHGITHDRVTEFSEDEFSHQLDVCHEVLSKHPAYIPFFAYPHGAHSYRIDEIVRKHGFVPVLANGEKNYSDAQVIHREILEYLYKCQNHQS